MAVPFARRENETSNIMGSGKLCRGHVPTRCFPTLPHIFLAIHNLGHNPAGMKRRRSGSCLK
ncbi:hypothetical protein BK187_05555 [Brucella melitensis]|nr:hypothetical protein BK187_05555 [Brucella melitensis]ARY37286.1 hypothetical protein BK217_05560 [Brucella melitensis]ARY59409.1 hypothetical protein BK195_05550 [Brucella melitensis]ARY62588.1 hypothetical protein BK199_05540 [Brucella melitensis]ARY68943.1 hypothetical protein BK196_05545 [Brucella melitensis]